MNKAALAMGGSFAALLVAVGVFLASPRQPRAALEVGGPFALTDGAGHHVTDRDYRGDWLLVYFGYTHCPDACPTTLGDVAAALGKLPPATRARFRVLFVTVDPARDTPPVMGDYARAFGPEVVGLTGTPAELEPVLERYHVYARRHDLKGGDYAMDHSSIIYIMRPDGDFAGLLDDEMPPADMAKRLADLVGKKVVPF